MEVLKEQGCYTRLGYWNDRKGENEIDIIAEDEVDNKIEFIEVKRQSKNFDEELLKSKAATFMKGKHSVNHVFSSPTSIINFTSKKPSYDDTRRSGRDNELLQRAQNDL